MPKLLLIAALVLGTVGASQAQSPDLTGTPAAQSAAPSTTPAGHADAQKKAWFDHAVGHILDGE